MMCKNLLSMQMIEDRIRYVVGYTGMSEDEAEGYLVAEEWDVHEAILSWLNGNRPKVDA